MKITLGEIIIVNELHEAKSFFTRLKGLLFKKSISEDEGMLISPCSQIHTFGMKFPIDVIFLSGDFTVLEVLKNIFPNKISRYIPESKYVLELAAGAAEKNSISKGQNLVLR